MGEVLSEHYSFRHLNTYSAPTFQQGSNISGNVSKKNLRPSKLMKNLSTPLRVGSVEETHIFLVGRWFVASIGDRVGGNISPVLESKLSSGDEGPEEEDSPE